jgi:NADPH-dependent curcumin reductase CurA
MSINNVIIYIHDNSNKQTPTGYKYFFEFTSRNTKVRFTDSVVLETPCPSTLEVFYKAFGANTLDTVLNTQFKVIPICFPQY